MPRNCPGSTSLVRSGRAGFEGWVLEVGVDGSAPVEGFVGADGVCVVKHPEPASAPRCPAPVTAAGRQRMPPCSALGGEGLDTASGRAGRHRATGSRRAAGLSGSRNPRTRQRRRRPRLRDPRCPATRAGIAIARRSSLRVRLRKRPTGPSQQVPQPHHTSVISGARAGRGTLSRLRVPRLVAPADRDLPSMGCGNVVSWTTRIA